MHQRDAHFIETNHSSDLTSWQANSFEWPDNPVDTAGSWVNRDQFTGPKSFGFFQCSNCFKTWLSAHAFPKYKQGCKSCELESLPVLLWKNEGIDTRNRERFEDEDKPHDHVRCEACRQGVCLRAYY